MVLAIIVCSCIICLVIAYAHRQHMEKLDELHDRDRDDGRDFDSMPDFDQSPKGKVKHAKGTKDLMVNLRPSIDAHRAEKGLPPVDWDKAMERADDSVKKAEEELKKGD